MKRSDDAFMDAQTIIDALSADQLAAAFSSVEREQAVDHLANERTAWERRGLSEEVMCADSESADAAVRGEPAIHALYSRHARFYRVGIMSAAFLAACFAVLLVAAVLIPAGLHKHRVAPCFPAGQLSPFARLFIIRRVMPCLPLPLRHRDGLQA